jgi:hypothetical protein
MINIPVNSNSIYVPLTMSKSTFFLLYLIFILDILSGCLKGEFDSTYPIQLNGIINQVEYRESIKRINHVFSLTRIYFIICLITYSLM